MGSPLPKHDFIRKFRSFGVTIPKMRKPSHLEMSKVVDGKTVPYTAVVHNKKVDYIYVKGARNRFKLTKKDGISDHAFRKA